MQKHFKTSIGLILLLNLAMALTNSLSTKAVNFGPGEVWRVSTGLSYAYHQGYDVPAWNADGSLLLFRGKKGQVYLVKSLNDQPEQIKLTETPVGAVQWDRKRPEVFYYVTRERNQQTAVYSYNLASQEAKILFKAPGAIQLAPGHPDGEHLLLHAQTSGGGAAEIYSLQTQKILIIPLPGKVCRVRFTKHPDLSIFCNLSNQVTAEAAGWIMDAYTGVARQLVSETIQNWDWQPGGNCFSYSEADRLCIINRKGEPVKVISELSGPHSWAEDGKSLIIAVTNKKSSYYGQIVVYNPDKGEVRAVGEHHFQVGAAMLQPNPNFSPDQTKAVYNRNDNGRNYPQVYVVKVSSPKPVKNLRLITEKSTLELTWAVTDAKEIKCYQIYKIATNGKRTKLGEVDKGQTKYNLKYEADLRSLEIISREFSGLESEPASVEVPTKTVSQL